MNRYLVCAVLLIALAGTACGGGNGAASSAGRSSPAANPTARAGTAEQGATEPGPVPAGWSAGHVEGLGFAVPPGMRPVTDGTGIPEATLTYRGERAEGVPIPPAMGFFVERGDVGPLDIRTQLVTEVRSDQLGAQPTGPARTITVAGASGATLVEWRWDYKLTDAATPVPSRQVEVVVQTDGRLQYGVLFGAPAPVLTDQVLAGFLTSLRVSQSGPSS